ncbi:hypothetical protein WA026_006559 [Henosepilachna vigintioctopunctata]|uniref:Uncharacterized protein n=1 Tax=Henosepilachna vigintioctopunctata TaxID=420089 RepID=A0AAW1UFM4_9CUCU
MCFVTGTRRVQANRTRKMSQRVEKTHIFHIKSELQFYRLSHMRRRCSFVLTPSPCTAFLHLLVPAGSRAASIDLFHTRREQVRIAIPSTIRSLSRPLNSEPTCRDGFRQNFRKK